MNSKAIGIIVAFTALTTALNFVKIPVPYMPTFSYMMGDIVIVIALLLFGAKPGVAVAFLSTIITMTILPGPAGLVGPPYYFIAVSTMLLGVYIAIKLIERSTELQVRAKTVILLTLLAVLTRTLIMLPLDYTVYGALVSVVSGLSMSTAYAIVIAAMPGIILYNITVPLYVIPTSYYIAKKLSKSLKLQSSLMAASRNSSGYSKPTRINAFFEYGFAEALALHLEKKEQMQKLSSTMAIS
jgi:riboflavin transporter FmnP